jgi:threonine aldolase
VQSQYQEGRKTVIDLRSDTVTLPSPAMREAIAGAELGDDVYGEDRTVNRLEQLAAELVGKEAALLVTSGTMGNLCALLAHAQRGQKVIAGSECHIFHYEGGGASALGGLIYHVVPNLADGSLDMRALELALAVPDDSHHAPAGLVCLENTHNRCGGVVVPLAKMAATHALAQSRGLPVHLDGARVFNAAVALGVDVREITQHVESVQFCLSKGLAAPVGSMLAGRADFIRRARRARKMLGGGMRQAGIIAAAGIVALTEMVPRLAEDHANARRLARGLVGLPGVRLDLDTVQTDIVIFELDRPDGSAEQLVAALRQRGVLLGNMGRGRVRAVTHYGISEADVDRALDAIAAVLAAPVEATPAVASPY